MSEERIKERCKREDIAIKVVQGFLEKDCYENTELYYSLQTILDLYRQEKEKNKKLTDEYLIQRDLINADFLNQNYIHKDKIKEKLDYQYMLWNTPNRQKEYSQEYVNALEELLEGE